ncbi:glycine rich protein [Tumebacillus sp. BK434]|uniref:glycoside hydrolase family 78 protein n=1 Tax=Tumebacillus sp. BK434 TaxID=2512169 RepID=UPI0010D72391|nr:glycine-rich protein [Tumebacillus sp. BK434]TCP57774.1 glycine rich protein [Tumebacillus sp. BK434]
MANYTLSNLPAKFAIGDTITINFTGAMQSLNIGTYREVGVLKIECWGGGGQHDGQSSPAGGGKGGYVVGELNTKNLRENGTTMLYCIVGGYANTFNGGGSGSKIGGGATDVRTDWTGGAWNNATSLNSRLIVAGGGGATTSGGSYQAGDGGGFTGVTGSMGRNCYQAASGGSQISGGVGGRSNGGTDMSPLNGGAGSFGVGGSSPASTYHGGGGGGGWYGGAGGVSDGDPAGVDCYNPGGGGSSYIAGHPSCPQAHPNQIALSNGSTVTGANPMAANGKIVMTVLSINLPPNSPNNLSPEGTSTIPAMLKTLNPTFSWMFSDPDPDDTQHAFRIIVRKQDASIVHDTGKLAGATNTYTLPGNLLTMNTLYSYTVTVWDKADDSAVSAMNYFMPSNAPIATPTFGTADPFSSPTGTSLVPRLTWFYSDPDQHAQSAYEVEVFRALDDLKVLGSGVIRSATPYYDVPVDILVSGVTYYWKVRVIDSTGLDSPFSNGYYFLTNHPPGTPRLVSPRDTIRTGKRPVFTATIEDDPEDDAQHYKIEIAEDEAFTSGLQVRCSEMALVGWEVKTAAGEFVSLPATGADSTYESGAVRYTWQTDLQEGKTYYWRMASIDATTGASSVWTPVRKIRCGNVLQFQGKTSISTTLPAARIVFSAVMNVPNDGKLPASIKIEACNNGHDAEPSWEDCTQAYLHGQYHRFANTVKNADTWAVNYRVTIKANDSLGPIEVDAIGISFD